MRGPAGLLRVLLFLGLWLACGCVTTAEGHRRSGLQQAPAAAPPPPALGQQGRAVAPPLPAAAAAAAAAASGGGAAAEATCELFLEGHGKDSDPGARKRSTARLGVALARLACTSSDGAPVAVALDTSRGWMPSGMASFSGVALANGSCPEMHDTTLDATQTVSATPSRALLYFCSPRHRLRLEEPVVRGVVLDAAAIATEGGPAAAAVAAGSWALLAFGGDVHATISSGTFERNRAGSVLSVMGAARLELERGTVIRGNTGSYGAGVSAWGRAQVAVHGCQFSDNIAAHGGGALFAAGSAAVTVNSSRLLRCQAYFGGGGFAMQSATMALADTLVKNCSGWEEGGAAYGLGRAHLSFLRCRLEGNSGGVNCGGICTYDTAVIDSVDSVWSGNTADFYAGVLSVGGNTVTRMLGSTFERNNASYGSVLDVYESADALIRNCTFRGNFAVARGAGMLPDMDPDAPPVRVEDSLFEDNEAEFGAAVFADGTSRVRFQRCVFRRNSGTVNGGALLAQEDASAELSNCTLEASRSPRGAAVCAWGNSTVTVANGTRILGGDAQRQGGGALAEGSARLVLRDALLLDNAAMHGGGVYAWQDAQVLLHNTTIARCNASSQGGGVAIEGAAELLLDGGSVLEHNAAPFGGGVFADDNTTVRLEGGSAVRGNTATGDGGGASIHGRAMLDLRGAAPRSITNNSAGHSGGGLFLGSGGFDPAHARSAAAGNRAPYDDDVSVVPTRLELVGGNCSGGQPCLPGGNGSGSSGGAVLNFASRLDSDGGVLPVALSVSGFARLPCAGLLVQAVHEAYQQVLGVNRSGHAGDVQLHLKLRLPPGWHDLSFSLVRDGSLPDAASGSGGGGGGGSGSVAGPSARLRLQVRPCKPGEVTASTGDACIPCVAGSYSLSPANNSCDSCPENAYCPGGTAIVAQPGFWTSAPASNQVHRCPHSQACEGDRALVASSAADCAPPAPRRAGAPPPPFAPAPCKASLGAGFADLQCSAGYRGHLCGSCAEGYGTTRTFMCRRCWRKPLIVTLYVAGALALLVLMGLLANSARVEAAAFAAQQQHLMLHAASAAATNSGDSGTVAHAAPQLHPTDLFKPLVTYFQWLLIVFSMGSIGWPPTLSVPVQAVAWLWSSASPETLSLDCLLPRGALPLAAAKVAFYLAAPAAMVAVLLALHLAADRLREHSRGAAPGRRRRCALATAACFSCGKEAEMPSLPPGACAASALATAGGAHAAAQVAAQAAAAQAPTQQRRSSLVSTAMVALYFFLPSLVRTTLSLFACVGVDGPAQPPYAPAAVGSYWLWDMDATCWAGYHRTLALFVGVPMLLVVCVGLPGSILALLWPSEAGRARMATTSFQRRYGFLYRSYRPGACAAWEAVIVAQTVLLVAVSVFGYVTGPWFAALIMNAGLAGVGFLLLVVRPHAHPTAGLVSLQLTGCLLATSYVAMTFLPTPSAAAGGGGGGADGGGGGHHAYSMAMGVVLLVLNVGVVASVVVRLARLLQLGRVASLLASRAGSSINSVTFGRLSRSLSRSLTLTMSFGSRGSASGTGSFDKGDGGGLRHCGSIKHQASANGARGGGGLKTCASVPVPVHGPAPVGSLAGAGRPQWFAPVLREQSTTSKAAGDGKGGLAAAKAAGGGAPGSGLQGLSGASGGSSDMSAVCKDPALPHV